MASSTIIYTTGVPGAGKTYCRGAVYTVTEFLPHETGRYIHNLPLFEDKIAEYVASRARPRGVQRDEWPNTWQYRDKVDEIRERLVRIPEEVIQSWRDGQSGPWEYFEDDDLSGAHLVLDEIHEMIGTGSPQPLVKQWEKWLGTLRHAHCTLEVITQDESRVHRCMRGRAGKRIELVDLGETRDPMCGILLDDWYRLVSAVRRKLIARPFVEVEYRQKLGKWVPNQRKFRHRLPEFFALYQSFTRAPAAENDARHGIPSMAEVPRFMLRNGGALSWRVAMVLAFAWVVFLGGWRLGLTWVMDASQNLVGSVEIENGGEVEIESDGGTEVKGQDDGNAGSDVVESESPEVVAAVAKVEALETRISRALEQVAGVRGSVVVVARCPAGVLGEDGTWYQAGGTFGGQEIALVERGGMRLVGGRWVPFRKAGKRGAAAGNEKSGLSAILKPGQRGTGRPGSGQ